MYEAADAAAAAVAAEVADAAAAAAVAAEVADATAAAAAGKQTLFSLTMQLHKVNTM